MWNDRQFIRFIQYIAHLHWKDIDNGLKLLPKLTHEQIYLSSYSIMQVLISSVAKPLLNEFQAFC